MLTILLPAVLSLTGIAPTTLPEAFMSWPDVHGDQVVFTAEGDLWLGDLKTLQAKRLTSDAGVERQARFSPDGKEIAFLGNYDGTTSVYKIKTSGGTPEQLTFDQKSITEINGWSPDGKRLLVNYPSPQIFTHLLAWLDVNTKAIKPLKFEMASYSSVGTDDQIALTRVDQTWQAWFGYHGGQANPIWFGDLKSMQFKRIVPAKGSNEYPLISNGRVFFCQDDNGLFYIKSIKPDGSGLKVHAGPYDVPVQQLHGDASHLVYMKGPGLESIDLATGTKTPLNFHLDSDQPRARKFMTPATNWYQNANISPDAKRVLVEARGQIVSVPVKDGAAKVVLSKAGVRFREAAYSPDKKQIAYFSDESGEDQLYVANADGSKPVAWTKPGDRSLLHFRWSPTGKAILTVDSLFHLNIVDEKSETTIPLEHFAFSGVPSFDISSDGNWIVAQQELATTGFASIALYDVAKKKLTPIDLGIIDAKSPSFSSDGKWIGFLSSGKVSPEWDPVLNEMVSNAKTAPFLLSLRADEKSPFLTKTDEEEEKKDEKKDDKKDEKKSDFRIDFGGLASRLIQVPAAEGVYSEIQIAGNRVLLPTAGSLEYYDLAEKKAGTLTSLAPLSLVDGLFSRNIQLSKDATQVLIFGPRPRVVAVAGDNLPATAGAVNFGGLQLSVSPKEEWSEIYNDGWRKIRDFFYADNLHGIDWPAIRAKYQAYIPLVRDRTDLTYVIHWLQAEMNTGHMYTGGGDVRSLARGSAAGFLGVDLEESGGFLKITKILKGNGYITPSPLAAPGIGVKEGDFLVEVAGTPATAGTDFAAGLRNRSGKTIEIKVNSKPTLEGAKTVVVEPIASESDLRYYAWVDANREYVKAKSGGKLGYIHMRGMGQSDFADFIRQYFAQQHTEGLVVDIRFNGGGNLAGPLTEILGRQVRMWGNLRNLGNYAGRDTDAFLGHLACLVNEHSYSEGEGFPFYFRAAKLGPIFGKRTWGGYVGSWPDWPLVDGSTIAVSHYGGWTPKEGWVVEAEGVVPDREIENDPSTFAKGIDSQLDEAIAYLLKKAKDEPIVRPTRPAFPTRPLRGAKPVVKG